MQISFTEKKSIRKNFGKLKEILSIPNLIEVQKQSYTQFLSSNTTLEETVIPVGRDSFATSLSLDVCAFPTSFFIAMRVFDVSLKAIYTSRPDYLNLANIPSKICISNNFNDN